jgi:hypothetical protein
LQKAFLFHFCSRKNDVRVRTEEASLFFPLAYSVSFSLSVNSCYLYYEQDHAKGTHSWIVVDEEVLCTDGFQVPSGSEEAEKHAYDVK